MANRERPFYKGFASSISDDPIYDLDLVKADLKNHFFTRKGERVMFPEYGSSIWDIIFDLDAGQVEDQIREEVKIILESDPRFAMEQLEITIIEHGFIIDVRLRFLEVNIVDQLRLEFNSDVVKSQIKDEGFI